MTSTWEHNGNAFLTEWEQEVIASRLAAAVDLPPCGLPELHLADLCDCAVVLAAVEADHAAEVEAFGFAVAWDRAETDECERLTPGCSVVHNWSDSECATW